MDYSPITIFPYMVLNHGFHQTESFTYSVRNWLQLKMNIQFFFVCAFGNHFILNDLFEMYFKRTPLIFTSNVIQNVI